MDRRLDGTPGERDDAPRESERSDSEKSEIDLAGISPLRATCVLTGFLAMVGLVSFYLMKQRGMQADPQSVAIATLAVAAGLVPPLCLKDWLL